MPEGVRAGYDVFWREVGTGPRRALALHCSLAHGGTLVPMLEALGDLLTAIVPDLPGHGKSADWAGEGSFQDAVVAIAQTFLDEADGPLDLIGHSFGATALMRLAHEAPGRVRTLTLIEPPFYFDPPIRDLSGARIQRARDAAFAGLHAKGDMRGAARAFADEWGAPGGWEALNEQAREAIAARMHLIEGAGAKLNADCAGLLRPGGLEAIAMPVLLVNGDRSPPGIRPTMRYLAGRLPDVTRKVIDGAGHMAPLTHPVEVSDAIRALMERVGPGEN